MAMKDNKMSDSEATITTGIFNGRKEFAIQSEDTSLIDDLVNTFVAAGYEPGLKHYLGHLNIAGVSMPITTLQ